MELTAVGTQLGAVCELRFRLEPDLLRLELTGHSSLEVPLGDADFFDLGCSPLFNSLPVMRDRLLEAGLARDYLMRWVDVPLAERHHIRAAIRAARKRAGLPSLRELHRQDPIRQNEFVTDYPGIARRADEG